MLSSTGIGRWIAIAASLALLAGCASSEKQVLRMGIDSSPGSKRMMWPSPPDVPRYVYGGTLTGEANFQREDTRAREGVSAFLHWLAGLVKGEAPPVELQRPQTGAVDAAGRIYVTDISRQAVFVFDGVAGALQVWDRAEGLANFSSPIGIAVAADGMVYVADAELGIVARLDRNGGPQSSFGRGLLQRPTGLAYDRVRKEIYVSDTYAHDIKVFSESGQLARVIGVRGEGKGEFNFPTHLAFADGKLYVTDTLNSRVQIIDGLSMETRLVIGSRGLIIGNMVRPKGVAVDSEGNVYVVESQHDHLLVYNRHGQFLMGIGGTGQETGQFYLPSGVWVDSFNRIFVSDMFNGRVVLFQFLGGGQFGER